jgi:hypothetical protein
MIALSSARNTVICATTAKCDRPSGPCEGGTCMAGDASHTPSMASGLDVYTTPPPIVIESITNS